MLRLPKSPFFLPNQTLPRFGVQMPNYTSSPTVYFGGELSLLKEYVGGLGSLGSYNGKVIVEVAAETVAESRRCCLGFDQAASRCNLVPPLSDSTCDSGRELLPCHLSWDGNIACGSRSHFSRIPSPINHEMPKKGTTIPLTVPQNNQADWYPS